MNIKRLAKRLAKQHLDRTGKWVPVEEWARMLRRAKRQAAGRVVELGVNPLDLKP